MSAPLALVLAAAACGTAGEETAEPLLRPGDRVALVGGSFWEEERRGGEMETALTLAVPDVTFRHLGWSGDMADQSARRFFKTAKEGREHLLEHVDLVQPTVILVAYGQAESLPGGMSVDAFEANLHSLLDELEKRTERIVLVGPVPPRTASGEARFDRSSDLPLYQQAVLRVCTKRRLPYVMTVDWTEAVVQPDPNSPGDSVVGSVPVSPAKLLYNGLRLGPYEDAPRRQRMKGVDYNNPPRGGLAWATGLNVALHGPGSVAADPGAAAQIERVDALRDLIRAKNDLFFQRHRPQNETYLRGFRAHEQGNNAVEIKKFEPLVAAKDAEIQALRQQIVKDSE